MLPPTPYPFLRYGSQYRAGRVIRNLMSVADCYLPLERRAGALENVVLTLAETALNEANATGAAACPDARLRRITPQAGTTVNAAELTIIGTAQYAAANRYSLAVRPTLPAKIGQPLPPSAVTNHWRNWVGSTPQPSSLASTSFNWRPRTRQGPPSVKPVSSHLCWNEA